MNPSPSPASRSDRFEVKFKPDVIEAIPQSVRRVALLVTSEYEGIFRNGGIGTYYRTLSEKMAAEGWSVVLLLCQTQERFGGVSHLPALKHIFSTTEAQDVLELAPMHLALLAQFKAWEWVDYENYCALFFAQAIAAAFEHALIYIEFPETVGFGYRTTQAKRAGVLGQNCFTAVTLHSGQEWLLEAHGQHTFPVPYWSLQTSHYEQASFEQADLAFFPSRFLKEKVASYGWKTDHALHLPYFVPEVELGWVESSRGDLGRALDSGLIPVVFFGRLEERKGLVTFIEAIRLLEAEVAGRIQLVFIGKSVQLQVELLKHLDSEQYIREQLEGRCAYQVFSDLYSREAIEFIDQLDHPIVCLTSHQENFPNAALEMGQLPMSLIVSDTGGFRETLDLIGRSHGVRWFTPGDEKNLLECLKQALGSYPESSEILGRDAIYKINQQLLQQRKEYINQALNHLVVPISTQTGSDESRQWILGMTLIEEQTFLENYARNEYSGRGEIVDLGCWLGSSSISLAIGLAENLQILEKKQRIHAYDIFIWSFDMGEQVIGTSLEGKYEDGDSFLDEYTQRINSWNQFIQVYPGDLTEIGWHQGEIECLFIDAMKTWSLTNSILRKFFPSLIPGVSLVIHQDFAHYYTSWIHLIMYRLRKYFVPVDIPWLYPSKAFRYVSLIPNEVLQTSYSFDNFSKAEAEVAFNYSLSITPQRVKPNVLAAKVMYFIHINNFKQAQQEFEQATGSLDSSEWLELNKVKNWLWFSTSESLSFNINLYLRWLISAIFISSLQEQFECFEYKDELDALQESNDNRQASQSLQNLTELETPHNQLSETDKELLPIASDKLSMLSFEERSYLQNYARNEYTGRGEIVDLGCWLGSSTIPLAIGLGSNFKVETKEERIHAYDIFIWWSSYMDQHLVGTASEGKYKDGDSFVEEFIERIQPWSSLIQVYPGDLNRIGWDHRPIELIFIDAMKSWELSNSILKNFFPSLIPGLSLVVHQDFAHFYQVWIHLIMYRLREYLIPLEDHPFLYSSKVFRYMKAIPEELLQPYSLASFSEAEAEAAFAYSLNLTPKKLKSNVAAAKVMYFIQAGNVDRAKSELSQARAKYDRSEWFNLVDVEEWLERGDWFKQYR